MAKKANQTAGWNDRYADSRYQGFSGDGGANQFPFETAVEVTAEDPAGTYDSTVVPPAGSFAATTVIEVTEAFDGGADIIVGRAGDTDALVTLVDAIDITTPGTYTVNRNVTWDAAQAMRVTIGGAPTQGSCKVSTQFQY